MGGPWFLILFPSLVFYSLGSSVASLVFWNRKISDYIGYICIKFIEWPSYPVTPVIEIKQW